MTLYKGKKKNQTRKLAWVILVVLALGLVVLLVVCRSKKSAGGRNIEEYTVMIGNDKPGASPPYTAMEQGGWGGQVNATITGNIETIGKGCPCISLDGGTKKVSLI
jgi:hypothetical protein